MTVALRSGCTLCECQYAWYASLGGSFESKRWYFIYSTVGIVCVCLSDDLYVGGWLFVCMSLFPMIWVWWCGLCTTLFIYSPDTPTYPHTHPLDIHLLDTAIKIHPHKNSHTDWQRCLFILLPFGSSENIFLYCTVNTYTLHELSSFRFRLRLLRWKVIEIVRIISQHQYINVH